MIKKRTIGIYLFAALPAVMIMIIAVNQKQDQEYKTNYSILISHYTLPEKDFKVKSKTNMVIIFKTNTIQLVKDGEWLTYRIDKYIEKDKTYILEMIYATFLEKEDYPDLAYLSLRGDRIWYFTVGIHFQQTIIFHIDVRDLKIHRQTVVSNSDLFTDREHLINVNSLFQNLKRS